MTFGEDAAIAGGSSTDTLYETGNDSARAAAAGTKVRHATFGEETTTFTSTYTLTDAATDSHTHRTTSTYAYGTAGRVNSGTVTETLTAAGTLSHTLDEHADRTVYWDTTNSHGGAYDVTESASSTHALSSSSSLVLGTDATIASGTSSDSISSSDTFSHSAPSIYNLVIGARERGDGGSLGSLGVGTPQGSSLRQTGGCRDRLHPEPSCSQSDHEVSRAAFAH